MTQPSEGAVRAADEVGPEARDMWITTIARIVDERATREAVAPAVRERDAAIAELVECMDTLVTFWHKEHPKVTAEIRSVANKYRHLTDQTDTEAA